MGQNEIQKKKDANGVFKYLAALIMPTPEQGQGRKVMESMGEQEVDQRGNPIKKKRVGE